MRVIDLTRPMEEGMPVYPGDPLFRARPVAEHETDGFRVTELSFGTHTGTHIDFPFHFFQDGEQADAFGPEAFYLKSAALDVSDELEKYRYGSLPPVILPELLEPFAPVFSEVEAVVLKTGWSRPIADRRQISVSEPVGGREEFPDRNAEFTAFPSFLPETADWLAEQPIRLLGLETPSLSALAHYSPEDGPLPPSANRRSESDEILFYHADAEAHRILLGRIPPLFILENLLIPDDLPAIRLSQADNGEGVLFTLAAFPLRLVGGDASPVRAVAILDR